VRVFGNAVNYHHDDRFVVGLRKSNVKIHGNVDLDSGWDQVAYILDISTHLKIHLIICVSYLKR
jgi:hypothetical protein